MGVACDEWIPVLCRHDRHDWIYEKLDIKGYHAAQRDCKRCGTIDYLYGYADSNTVVLKRKYRNLYVWGKKDFAFIY